MNKQKIMRDSERYLKRTEAYKENRDMDENYKIEFVIAKGNTSVPDVIAYATRDDEVLSFRPYNTDNIISEPVWSFCYDADFFSMLEQGYDLVGMPLDAHFNVWHTIEEWHNGDIEHTQGMQMYLGYCKRNGISKEKCSYDGMDVMTLYDGKTPANTGITNPQKEHER